MGVLEDLRERNQEVKKRRIEQLLRMKLGMSFDDFCTKGSQAIPAELYGATWREIEALRLECEIIVAGFVDKKHPALYSYDDQNEMQLSDHFVAIGSGAWIAKAALYQRRCRETAPLEEVLYCVYEAKKLSEIAPGVGRATNIGVTAWGSSITERMLPLTNEPKAIKVLDNYYRQFCFRQFKGGKLDLLIPSLKPDEQDPQ